MTVYAEISFKCPVKKCSGLVESNTVGEEGNDQGVCDTCDTTAQFHYKIEIEDVRTV